LEWRRNFNAIANIYVENLIIMQYSAEQWRDRKDKKTEESYKDTKSLPLCLITITSLMAHICG